MYSRFQQPLVILGCQLSRGRILDDDDAINTLEVLKTEAADVGRKVGETDQVMADIENTSKQYLSLSAARSHIYFAFESLHQVHLLYLFSLKFFLDIHHSIELRRGERAGQDQAEELIEEGVVVVALSDGEGD